MEENKLNEAAPDPRSKWQKIRAKLLPSKRCPDPEPPWEWKDVITIESIVQLSFMDKLRFLVTGTLIIVTKTATENLPGKLSTRAESYVISKNEWKDWK